MDDFGSIIYIVFTIIAIVFSIIKKSNKKARSATPSAPTTNSDPFEEVVPTIERFFGVEKEITTPEPVIIPEPKKEIINTLEDKKRDMEAKFSRMKQINKPQQEEFENTSEEQTYRFNLREAVIYSEILKRPNL